MVELLITIIVTAILMTGLNGIFLAHSNLSQRTRDAVVLNSFAESKVEALRSKGFLALTNGTTNITSELPSELRPPRSGSITVSTHSPAVKVVDISITYNDQGVNRSYSFKTYVGELGVGQY